MKLYAGPIILAWTICVLSECIVWSQPYRHRSLGPHSSQTSWNLFNKNPTTIIGISPGFGNKNIVSSSRQSNSLYIGLLFTFLLHFFLLISTLQKWLSSCERAPSFRRARKLPGLSIDTSLFSVRLRSRKGPCAKIRAVKIRHKIQNLWNLKRKNRICW